MNPSILRLAILSLPGLLGSPVWAAFENWTSADGRTTELELVKVTEANGEKVGTFRTRNGGTAVLPASKLAEADRPRLDAWKQPSGAAASEPAASASPAPPSAFDSVLEGNLERVEGKSLRRVKEIAKPTKYYIFYHSASWCGPCVQFTPSLVSFYNKHKEGNNRFELVLITHDREEDAMKEYAVSKSMPWPVLKLSKVESFNKKFPQGVSGIPSVVVCDLDGKIITKTQSISALEELVKAD